MKNDLIADKIVLSIKNDTKSGATEMTRDALIHLMSYANSMDPLLALNNKVNLISLANRLTSSRPSMAALQNILNEWRARVLAFLNDGSLVNKCGTSLLAMAEEELSAAKSPFIHPHNIYFDITPAALITQYINEFGVQESWPWTNAAGTLS